MSIKKCSTYSKLRSTGKLINLELKKIKFRNEIQTTNNFIVKKKLHDESIKIANIPLMIFRQTR